MTDTPPSGVPRLPAPNGGGQGEGESHSPSARIPASADLYQLLVESVQDYAIFALDPNGHILTWSAGAARLKGYARTEIIGRHFSVFYPPEDVAAGKPDRELEEAAKSGRLEDEGWRVRKDGTLFWASVVITALRDELGALVGFAKVTRDLTERRAAVEALRESEERFRLLIESVRDYAIFLLDPEGHVASWNAGAARIKGYSAEEIVGRHFSTFYPQDKIEIGFPQHELEVAAREGRFEDEGWRVRKDGSRFWANVIITALRNPAGRLVGFAKVTRDLTERRAAEAEARRLAADEAARAASERQLRTLADAIPTLAWTAQLDGYIDWYNARWYEYTGTTPEEMAGWGWQSVHHPESLPHVLEEWHRSIATGRPFEMTFPLRGKDGTFRHFLTRAEPVRDSDGRVTRWFGTNADVEAERTARKAAEDAAARTQQLQSLTASLAGASTLEEVAGVIVAEVTAATGASTGMLALRVAGTNEAEIIRQTGLHPDVLAQFDRFRLSRSGPAAECLRTGHPAFVESRTGSEGLFARFPDMPDVWEKLGTHALAAVPLDLAGITIGVVSFTFTAPRTFTSDDRAFFLALGRQAAQAVERARLFAAERAARAEAEAANRAKSEFLATMSHELRTPLNAIGGYAQLIDLGLRGPVTPAQHEDLERIRRSQSHLTSLINEVLNYARLESRAVEYNLQPTVLADAVSGIVALVEPQRLAKQLTLEVQVAKSSREEPLRVVADGEKLQQILLNLLANAVKFTPNGGRLTVEVPAEPNARGMAALRVRDTGIGIPSDKLESIFEPFVQIGRSLNSPGEGTGLGLAISRDLARGMGGELTAESVIGEGSTFTLTIPVA